MTLGVLICPSGVPALAADLHVTGSIEGQEKIASPFQMVAPQLHLPNHKIIDLVRKSHVFCDRSAGVFAGDRERIIDCASNIESLISAGLSGDEFVKNILDDNASAVEAIIFRIDETNSTRSAITSSNINYSELIGAHSTIGSGSEEFQRWLPDAIQNLEYYDKIINLKEFPYEVIDIFFSFMNSRLLFSSVRPWLRQRSDWGTFIEAVYFDNQDRTWKKLPNRIFVSIDAIRLIGNKFYFRWSPFCYLYVNTVKNTYFVCLNLDQKLCVGIRIRNTEFLHGNTNSDCHQDNIASSFSEKVERCTLSIFEHANSPRVMYQTKQIINLNGCNVRKTGTSFNLKFEGLGIFSRMK